MGVEGEDAGGVVVGDALGASTAVEVLSGALSVGAVVGVAEVGDGACGAGRGVGGDVGAADESATGVVGVVSLEASGAEGDGGGCAGVVLGSGAVEVGGGAGAHGAGFAMGGGLRAGGSSGRLRRCVLWSCQRDMARKPKKEQAVKALPLPTVTRHGLVSAAGTRASVVRESALPETGFGAVEFLDEASPAARCARDRRRLHARTTSAHASR